MQQIIPILMLAVFATVLMGGQAALASSSKSTFNINVTCLNGAHATKQVESQVLNNVNINVNCSNTGGGQKGDKGDQGIQGVPGSNGKNGINGTNGEPGKNGQNATVTIITTNQTGNSTFATKHFSCSSVAMMPFSCKHK